MLKKILARLEKAKIVTWDRMDGSSKALAVAISVICAFTILCVMYLDHERAVQKINEANYATTVAPATPITVSPSLPKLTALTTKPQRTRRKAAGRPSPVATPTAPEFIDSRGVKHSFITENETLCRISKREYGTTALAMDIAWFNGFDKPDHILKDGKILLPPSEKLRSAPFGWPEIPATEEQIVARAFLIDEKLPQPISEPVDSSVNQTEPVELSEQPSMAPACTTKQHIVIEGETTISDVARNEYDRDPHGLGLALGAANRMEGRTQVSLGEDLIIPCLGQIRPSNPAPAASEKDGREQ